MRGSIVFVLLAAPILVGGDVSAVPYAGRPPLVGNDGINPSLVALDSAGNRYVAGTFFQTADFDPGKGVVERTVHGPGPEPFVAKYDANGALVWAQTFGGTGTDNLTSISLNNTTVYVSGDFDSNDAVFGYSGIGPSISAHTDAGNFKAGYVLALDVATGAPMSGFNGSGAQIFGGTGGGQAWASVVYAFGTNLYVGGAFTSLGFGVGGSGSIDTTGQFDGFVAALDGTTGAARTSFSGDAVQTFAGNGHEFVRGIVQTNGVLYVAGEMGSTNFGVGAVGTVSSGAVFNSDAFVAAIQTSNGAKVAAFGGDGIVTFGGTGTESGNGVATVGDVVYVVGSADGSDATIDGAGAAHPTIGGRDTFVLAVDRTSGAPVQGFAGGIQFFGSTGEDGLPGSIAATASAVYVAGLLGTANAGIGSHGSSPAADAYLLALDPATGLGLPGFADGGVQWLASSMGFVTAYGMAVGGGQVALAGRENGTAFVGRSMTQSVTNFPGPGGFVVVFDPATGDPLNMGANRKPAFVGTIVATPNPCVVGKPVKFRAVTSEPDGDKVKVSWAFGDAGSSNAKSPKFTFTTAGPAGAQATAVDGKGGQAVSAPLDLTVFAAGTPYFDVATTSVSLKFPAAGTDSIVVTGQFPLAFGVMFAGKSFSIDVGGVARTFTLDGFGRSPKGAESVVVKPPKDGVAKFTVKLTKGSYGASFADEGMTSTRTVNAYTPTVVTVTFDGVTNSETMPLFWTNKSGKAGVAK